MDKEEAKRDELAARLDSTLTGVLPGLIDDINRAWLGSVEVGDRIAQAPPLASAAPMSLVNFVKAFSAVSKPMFATKHSFRRIFQDLQYLRTVASLQSERAKNQRFWCAAEVLASEPRAAASPQALARVRDDFWKFAQEVSPPGWRRCRPTSASFFARSFSAVRKREKERRRN